MDPTDTIKALRVSIDERIQEGHAIATVLNRGAGAREIALAITKLQEAKMWAGMALGELGYKLPEEYRDEAK